MTSHKELYDNIASKEGLGYVKPSFFMIIIDLLKYINTDQFSEYWWPGDGAKGWRTQLDKSSERRS